MNRTARACVLLCALAIPTSALARDQPPDWLKRLAAIKVEAQAKAGAVVLLTEEINTVQPDGNVKTVSRYAVRIQTRDGREAAATSAVYLTDSGRVRDMHAWMIPPTGSAKDYGKSDVVDVALIGDDIYNEVRRKYIVAAKDAESGSVFGAEMTSERPLLFGQFEWLLHSHYPVKHARRVLTLPAGWRVSSVTFNHSPIDPSSNGNTYTWEASDLPGIEPEVLSPSYDGLAARIAVSCEAPAGGPWPQMRDWTDVSRWLYSVSERQVTTGDALTSKARDLVAGSDTDIARIRAIGKFVQAVRYISVQTGEGRGGGYVPKAATEVFAHNYGDCKAKATLMRAMLAAVGIESYSVLISSGDRTYVREQFPSPQQFNHAILAVVLKERYAAPAVVDHPAFGTLLFFDPTDEDSSVGHLPTAEQGSLALVVAKDNGALVRMPQTGPEGNAIERQVDASVAADGTFSATLQDKCLGEWAVYRRAARRHLSDTEYREGRERWLAGQLRTVKVSKVDCRDDQDAATFQETIELASPGYAQLVQGKLLIIRPPNFDEAQIPKITAASRLYPVLIEARQVTAHVRIALPPGYKPDELPGATDLTSPFGRFKASWKQDGASLVGEWTLRLENCTVLVDDYPALKQFVDKLRAAQENALVFTRVQ
jgi:hypothetical protein